MADVEIYHPDTEGIAVVPEESVHHYRQAGWVLLPEWHARLEQRAAEENQKAAERQPSKPAVAKKE